MVIYRDASVSAADFSALAEVGVAPTDVTVRRSNVVVFDVPAGRNAHAMAKSLRGRSGVVAAARVGTVRALETVPPNDSRYAYTQSGLPTHGQRVYLGDDETYPYSMDLEPVWDAVFNTEQYAAEPDRAGVPIAIIDTGVTPSVMEDTGLVKPMWNYIADNTDTRDNFSIGGMFHGTRVAGLMGAQSNNAYAVAGTLYATRSPLLVYKTLDGTGSGTSDDTIVAMMDAADDGAKIINASLGEPAVIDWPDGPFDTTYDLSPDVELRGAWQAAVDYCVAKGALVVAATGNFANDTWYNGDTYTDVLYPAACDGVLAIGSINPETGERSKFSCYGPQVDLVAAGERVWTVAPNGTTSSSLYGTSFAAPLVSGALGTLWSLVPELPATELRDYALSAADTSTAEPGPDDETGFGRFDAWNTYEAMIASVAVQAQVTLTATPPSGFETRLSWSPAEGTGVHYRYGYVGGPSYETTATSGRLALSSDGPHTVYVRSYANDRFDALEATTTVVTPSTGMPSLTSIRAQGQDRYETAAAISRTAYPGTASAIVIASGENWPDGLAASVLAKTVGAPLLLTRRGALPIVTRDEILRLKPSRVYIVGGPNAVGEQVKYSVESLAGIAYTVERIGGVDRYDTAALIALKAKSLGGTTGGTAIIASGMNYPDALAGAPLAARAGWPILLVRTTNIPWHTSNAMQTLGVTKTVVLGGERVVDPIVLPQLPAPQRVAGADRYATSREIANYATPAFFDGSTIGLSTGKAFPDALSAGPLLAAQGAPLVLTDGITTELDTWLASRGGTVRSLTLFGGRVAMPYDLEFDIKAALRRTIK